jgi:D-alanyl-D-alanine carboxypeptidase/D-alanyl-D-alanine-endopeptidase (penicillin-binding protein 4)
VSLAVKRLLVLLLLVGLIPAQVREPVTAAPGKADLSERGPLPALSDYVNTIRARGQRLDQQGVLIESLETGQLFAQHNADVTFNPASVMKLATSLVALAAHGPDYRYRTNILADGPIDPTTRALEGDLVVEGGSDPMFSLADAQDVATEISRLGVSRVRGALRIAGPFYYFANGYRSNLSLETSANKLRAALQRAGISIEGETISGEKAGTLLLSHYSEPLVSLLLYQNAHSSNAVAEVIGASLGGPQAIHDYLVKELHLSESEIFVGRASGLDFNRITPRATIKVLRALFRVLADHALKPEDVMPVAGVDSGTLRGRLDSEDVRGTVIAKTGTLVTIDNGVSTLVGVAYTRARGPLLFAVFNSGGNVHAYRRLQDQFIEQLIAEEGGASAVRRSEDALAHDTRNTILQVFAGAERRSAEVTAE